MTFLSLCRDGSSWRRNRQRASKLDGSGREVADAGVFNQLFISYCARVERACAVCVGQ